MALLVLGACQFAPHGATDDGAVTGGDGAMTIDAPPDGPSIDAPAECTSFASHYFDACALPAPDGDITLDGAWTLSTDDGVMHGPNSMTITPPGFAFTPTGGVPVLAISINTLHVHGGASLHVTGAKPLMIAAWTSIAIDGGGAIDANSTRAGGDGAGANPSDCAAHAATAGADEKDNGGGSGGGGGGAFQGHGGAGGKGDTGGQNAGGTGGTSTTIPARLRGGCAGAASGKAGPDPMVTTPSDDNTTAAGGSGGGAILLAGKVQIAIAGGGFVLAGGAGGQGAELHSAVGGGGGGAGGLVALESPAIQLAAGAFLTANGGGGGASGPFAGTGVDGQDGQASAGQAAGGTGNGSGATTCALAGASGGAAGHVDGDDEAQTAVSCGGGGGGGAAGYVVLETTGSVPLGGVIVSPGATINQLPPFSP